MPTENDPITEPANGSTPLTPSRGVAVLNPQDIIDDISKRVTAELSSHVASQILSGGDGGNGGKPPGPPDEKTFLGLSAKGFPMFLLKGVFVVGGSLFAWYTYVNTALSVRPTHEEAAQMVDDYVGAHEKHGQHPSADKLLEAHGEQLQQLNDIQIRQTAIQETQATTLENFREDLRKHRHRHR